MTKTNNNILYVLSDTANNKVIDVLPTNEESFNKLLKCNDEIQKKIPNKDWSIRITYGMKIHRPEPICAILHAFGTIDEMTPETAPRMLSTFGGTEIYPNNKRIHREPNLTFKMLGIPIGSILTYVDDPDIACMTVDEKSTVMHHGKYYTLSNLACILKGGKKHWQGGLCFRYRGVRLTLLRKHMGL